MKKIVFFITLLFSNLVYAGGDSIQIKIISYNKEQKILIFQPLPTPNLNLFSEAKKVTFLLNYECHSSVYSCLTRKRTFNKNQYHEALKYLSKIAIPGNIIELGIMGSGFYKHKSQANTYITSGLFISHGTIFVYENPFL
ncbi:MAG: hypothetical protein V4525_15975 [Pseudomonadota bacterium]